MQSLKRTLIDALVLSAIVVALALAWGSPFVSSTSARAQDQALPQQPQQDQSQSGTATFTGTIVNTGEYWVLRDASGDMHRLDDAQRARQFQGETVKVVGQLDASAGVIHVESIKGAEE